MRPSGTYRDRELRRGPGRPSQQKGFLWDWRIGKPLYRPGAAMALITFWSFTTSKFHSFLPTPCAAPRPAASGSHKSGACSPPLPSPPPSSSPPPPNPKPRRNAVRAGIDDARRSPRSVPRSLASRMRETTRCTCCVITCDGGRSLPRNCSESSA